LCCSYIFLDASVQNFDRCNRCTAQKILDLAVTANL
jgi:predicted Zn-ribbon and HTH transcriptional regulator